MAKEIVLEQLPGESTEQYYRRLAKAADQRLVRLEALQHEDNFRNVTKWSYERAMRDIKKWSGDNRKRFNTKLPGAVDEYGEPVDRKSDTAIQSKIRDIKTFLEAPTSSKTGIVQGYQKRVDTINEKYHASFTWEHFANFVESKTWENLDMDYGSKTKMIAIGIVKYFEDPEHFDSMKEKILKEIEKIEDPEEREKKQEELNDLLDAEATNGERIRTLLEKASEYNVKISNNGQANGMIKRWLKDDGIDFDDLID